MKNPPSTFQTKYGVWRLIAVVMLAAALMSGCRGTVPGGGFRLNAAERMMWSTYPVGTSGRSGTGIAIRLREPGLSGNNVTAVVTSAHVLEAKGNGPVFIALRVPDDLGNVHTAVITIQPEPGSGRYYVRHPEHDVAAFAIEIPPEAAGIIALPSCLESKDIGRRGAVLHAGDEVYFAGFPEVMTLSDGVFPLLRSGRVASYPAGTPEAGDMFYIDANAYPGDSGAPVFAVRGRGGPRLEGIIVQRAGSEGSPNSHLAIAVHARVIRETLELLAERERRSASSGRVSE